MVIAEYANLANFCLILPLIKIFDKFEREVDN